MSAFEITVEELKNKKELLRVGDTVLLSGTVYTARDAAHKRLFELLDQKKPLPFSINGAVIYYAGPTPAKPGQVVGSFGPTTSARMDAFTPRLLDLGLLAIIGKGDRDRAVLDSIKKNRAVYFCAGGGFGALIANSIISCREIAFAELGCESIKCLQVKNMPLTVAADITGNSIFDRLRSLP